jgi:acyl-CoA thioesterase-1
MYCMTDRPLGSVWARPLGARALRCSACALALACAALGCGGGSGDLQGDDSQGAGGESPGGDGRAGSGAASGAAGAGGGAAAAGSSCVPGSLSTPLSAPSPLVSVDKPATASDSVVDLERLVDGRYSSGAACSFGLPTPDAPAWAAIEVGSGPSRVLVTWQDPGAGPYDDVRGGAPADYRIETSDDSTDGEDGEWNVVVEVTDNPVRGRTHTFDFTGMSWLRLVVTAAPDSSSEVKFDELAVHDISDSGTELPEDTWLFMGDSITQAAFVRNRNPALVFANIVHEAHPAYDPAMINAGIGGDFSSHGAGDVEQWLALNPGLRHVAISYGTNDSWGGGSPASSDFEQNLRTIVDAVLDDGRVPVLVRIPYASEDHPTLEAFNDIVDALQQEYGLPCGPDLYTWFLDHPDELSSDGVHPTPRGYGSINELWAAAVDPLYTDP